MEREEETSVKTISDDEYHQSEGESGTDEDNDENEGDGDEWESVSQISEITSETSTSTVLSSSTSSSVWIYFDKNPAYAPGYSVCKKCLKKYQLSTSVTSLRKHLDKHNLKAPTKTEKVEKKQANLFNKREQKEHDNYLIQWFIQDLQPFTVVDNPSFRAFVNYFCPRYAIPGRQKTKGKNLNKNKISC